MKSIGVGPLVEPPQEQATKQSTAESIGTQRFSQALAASTQEGRQEPNRDLGDDKSNVDDATTLAALATGALAQVPERVSPETASIDDMQTSQTPLAMGSQVLPRVAITGKGGGGDRQDASLLHDVEIEPGVEDGAPPVKPQGQDGATLEERGRQAFAKASMSASDGRPAAASADRQDKVDADSDVEAQVEFEDQPQTSLSKADTETPERAQAPQVGVQAFQRLQELAGKLRSTTVTTSEPIAGEDMEVDGPKGPAGPSTNKADSAAFSERMIRQSRMVEDIAGEIRSAQIGDKRARVVLGEGRDRIALTVAMEDNTVRVEATATDQDTADLLQDGSEELAEALRRHGFSLSDFRSKSDDDAQQSADGAGIERDAANEAKADDGRLGENETDHKRRGVRVIA